MKICTHLGIIFAVILGDCYCNDKCHQGSDNKIPPCTPAPSKVEVMDVHVGVNVSLLCTNSLENSKLRHGSHRRRWKHPPNNLTNYHKKGILWQKRSCESNGYMGVSCDVDKAEDLDSDSWRPLDIFEYKVNLVINNTKEQDSGVYRCIYSGGIEKIWVLKIVDPQSLNGPQPKVVAVDTSNITYDKYIIFTLRCNVSSRIPPKIYWFKQCYARCDVNEKNICYCHIKNDITSHNISDTYLSKLKLYNARHMDSGNYVCIALTEYGKDYQTIAIKIPNLEERGKISPFLLFLVPIVFFIPILLLWPCYFRRKSKNVRQGPAYSQYENKTGRSKDGCTIQLKNYL